MAREDLGMSRNVAVLGGIIGLIAAVAAFAGMDVGLAMVGTSYGVTNFIMVASGVNIVLTILTFVNAGVLRGNPRLHGSLLALWGFIGLFTGFGAWLGSLLVLIGGIMAYAKGGPMVPGARRPAA